MLTPPPPTRPPPSLPPPTRASGERKEPSIRPGAGPSLWRAVLASVALALAAQAWILPLPLRLDDFALLRDPGGLWAQFAELARREEAPRATFFRPALWSLWWLVRAIFGEPVRALPYHVAGWLVHGLAAGATALAVGRVAGARAALLAGAFAGVAAGGIQAVAWTAAQGDLLAGAGAAVAVALVACGRPRLALAPLTVALLAKITGVVAAGVAVLLACGLAAAAAGGVSRADTGVGGSARSAGRRVPGCGSAGRGSAGRGPGSRGSGGGRGSGGRGSAGARRLAAGALRFARAAVLARTFALGTGCAVVLVIAARSAYVGGLELATGAQARGLPGALETVRGALGALAQALVPVDRDPAFADLAPVAERLLGAHAHAAGLLVLLPLAAAAVAAPGARRRLGLLVLAAALLLLPAGAMHAGLGGNHQGRHVYPALLALAAALGVALDALLARPRAPAGVRAPGSEHATANEHATGSLHAPAGPHAPARVRDRAGPRAIGALLAVLAFAVTADGLVHVARVERAGARVLAASYAALAAAAEEHAASGAARPLDVFLMRGREGPGSSLSVTGLAYHAALAPPFRAGPPGAAPAVRVHGVPDRAELEARLSGLELADLDAAVFGPAPDGMAPPALRGAARRAQLVLRRWTPTSRGLDRGARASDVACRIELSASGEAGARVHVGAPGTAARILALWFPAGPACDLRVVATYADQDRAHTLHLPAGAGERPVAFALAPEIARGFTPLAFVDVAGARPDEARLLDALPACGLELAHPGPLALDPAAPIALRLTLPAEARGATRARFDLRLRPPSERWPFSADRELDATAESPLDVRLELIHTDPTRDGPPPTVYPWAVAVEDVILPLLRELRVDAGVLSVRARVLHVSGLEAARSAWVSVPYRAR